MAFSSGFVFLVIFVIIPGLTFRRFYYSGEFSKEFNSDFNLLRLLVSSIIPGFLFFFLAIFIYSAIWQIIDIDLLFSSFDDLNIFKFINSFSIGKCLTIEEAFTQSILPFWFFLIYTSLIGGVFTQNFVRYSKLDLKFKVFRFKNYWFYLLKGEYATLNKRNRKNETTQSGVTYASVRVNTNDGVETISGGVLDYELESKSNTKLSKLVLTDYQILKSSEEFYSSKKNGTIVIDCKNVIDIDFRYIRNKVVQTGLRTDRELEVREDGSFNVLKKKYSRWNQITGLILILLLPVFLFKVRFLEDFYFFKSVYHYNWIIRLFTYLIVLALIVIQNKYKLDNGIPSKIIGKDAVLKKQASGLIIALLIIWYLILCFFD